MNEPKDRPYVICHMQSSIDGRISGKFFFTPAAEAVYESDNDIRKSYRADAIMNGAVTFHYVDSVGFRQIDGFLPDNPLKNAEMAMEDDYGMIDGIINNGKNPALEEQKEQMVAKQPPLPFREQLKRAQERHQAQQSKRPHPAHDRKKDMAL